MNSLYSYQNQLLTSTTFLFRRSLLDKIDWNERVIGVVGARGVGKTTCLLQRLSETDPEGKATLYVSMDNLANPYSSLLSLAEDFRLRGGKTLMLDEIHKYRGWAQEIKNIYDLYPDVSLVFSGSSVLRIMDEGVDLSRRAVLCDLHGLSFREYISVSQGIHLPVLSLPEILQDHIRLSREIVQKIRPIPVFNDYLKSGFYPYFLQSPNSYLFKLESTINYILEYEIPSMFNLDYRNVQKLKRALRYIAGNLPYQPNITKLAEAVELNRNTLLQYLFYLEKAGVIHTLYTNGSFYGKLTKPGKILLYHPNLIYALSSRQQEQGSIRECFFVNQLRTQFPVELAGKGDFLVDGQYTFEIGGKGKTRSQIAGIASAFIVSDDIEFGFENKIPLWMFGFLY